MATRYDGDICSEPHIGPAESETLSMRGHSMFENRENSAASDDSHCRRIGQGRPVAAILDMHAAEKSDIGIVPKKVPNKIGRPMAEVPEGRPVTKGNF